MPYKSDSLMEKLNHILNKLLDERLHNKPMWNKLLRVILIFLFVVIILSPLLYVCYKLLVHPLFLALNHIYINAFSYIIVCSIWLLVVVVLMFALRYFFDKKASYYPILRTITYRICQLLPFYCIIICAINLVTIDTSYYQNDFGPDWGLIEMMIICLIIMGGISEPFYLLTVPKLKYNFFLRPFYSDASLEIDNEIKEYFTEDLVEVADPTSMFGNEKFSGKGFFLPTKDWKRELEYYIRKAKLVFCCIGHSDGVKWEMFEHDDQLHKFIFYNEGIVSCDSIIESVRASNYASSKVYNVLCKMAKIDIKGGYYFIVRDNICFYSTNLSIIASYVINNVKENDLLEIELGDQINNLPDNNLGDYDKKVKFRYLHKDILRIMSIAFRPRALFSSVLVLLGVAYGLIKIVISLLGIALIIGGVALLLSFIWPSLRDGLDLTSTTEIIGYGSGMIVFGIGIITKMWDD